MTQTLALSRPLDGLRRTAAHAKRRAITFWRAHPREAVGAGVLGVVAAGAIAATALTGSTDRVEAAPPAPPPMIVKPIAADQAIKLNAEMPVTAGPNPVASPFVFRGSAAARSQALECLASAVYYEAGNQDADGERAVAQVVLNRVRHPAFPASVCGVVYQGSTRATGCQFTFTCDGSLYRGPDAAGWRRAYAIAEQAMNGSVYAPVGYATHYHANYVVPVWAQTLSKNAIVGAHIFYRWAGAWGKPPAFAQHYSGHEANAVALRNAALAAEAAVANQPTEEALKILGNIPGAELKNGVPGRVSVRLNLEAARKASAEAPHVDY